MEHPMRRIAVVLAALLVASAPVPARGQAPDADALIAVQRDAMKPLARMNGVWRGPAWSLQPGGERRSITQTERIGSLLGGTLKVIEGRGYDAADRVTFNAFGVVSYNPSTKSYSIRSYALGRQGDFPFTPTDDGYTWETPAGPGAIVRYTATVTANRLHEVGDRVVEGRPAVRVFEMTLERVGETEWPEAGAVPPR